MGLEHRLIGLETAFFFSEQGWVARFLWPDWPASLSEAVKQKVAEFHEAHPELSPIPEISKEWRALSRGLRSDPSSAEKVFECFQERFGHRVRWSRCERDVRGKLDSQCMIDKVGVAKLEFTWRSFAAHPPCPFSNDEEARAYQEAVKDVFAWARSRIQTVLDTLHNKLKALYGDRFRGLYVFGSYARPDAGVELPEDSDLDVALVLSDFKNSYDEIKRFSEITSDLELEHGIVLSVVPLREADYKEGRTNFSRAISSYAVPVK